MFSFLSKAKGRTSLIFDINAESVGAAVVLHEKSSLPHVVFSSREYFGDAGAAPRGARSLVEGMTSAVRRLDEFVHKNVLSHSLFHLRAPHEIHFFFSDSWIESKIKTLRIEWRKPKKITKRLLASIIAKEDDEFLKELGARFGVSEKSFSVIENKITSVIFLNGKPRAKRGKTAEISFHITALPKEIYKALPLHRANTFCSSFSAAATSAIASKVGEKDFVILDIADSLTSLAIVRLGALASSVTVPAGENMLLDAISKERSVSRAEAVSLVKMFFQGLSESETAASLKDIIASKEALWKANIEDMVGADFKNGTVPKTFYIVSRGDDRPLFMRPINTESVFEIGAGKMRVAKTLIDDQFLKTKVSRESHIQKDVPLFLLATHLGLRDRQ